MRIRHFSRNPEKKKDEEGRELDLNCRGIIRLNMAMEPVIHQMATIERARGRGLTDERRERANAHDQTRDIKQRKKHHMSKAKPESETTDKQFPQWLVIMGFGAWLSSALRGSITRRRVRRTRRATPTALRPITLVPISIIAMIVKVLRFHGNAIKKCKRSLNVSPQNRFRNRKCNKPRKKNRALKVQSEIYVVCLRNTENREKGEMSNVMRGSGVKFINGGLMGVPDFGKIVKREKEQ